MSVAAMMGQPVAKKKPTAKGEPKSYGTLIRVSDDFANALRAAASFEKLSMAAFATAYLQPVVEKRYRDAILKEAKRIEGEP
jgi:hypothetical protein